MDWFPKHTCGLYLEHNAHKDFYETLEERFKGLDCNWEDQGFESEEDFKLCIKNDDVWSLQWFPDTPSGSYKIMASSLDKIVIRLKDSGFIN